MADKNVHEELAALTEAVRELREDEVTAELRRLRAEVEKLRSERALHHCHGCTCTHVHWHTYPGTWTYPGTVTYPNFVVTSGTSTVTTTNAATGFGTTYSLTSGN